MSRNSRGRPISWVTVAIFLTGFAVGGIALTLGMWWLFWTGAGIVAVALIMAFVTDLAADVTLDPIHGAEGEPLVGRFGRTVSEPPEELEPRTFGHAPSVGRKEDVGDEGQ